MKKSFNDNLFGFDRGHIWHPYTSMKDPLAVYPVKSASGVRIMLDDGRELIDGMSSWWAAIHGYNVPELNRAVNEQINDMSHVMFGGLTHRPAVELAEILVDITPGPLQKIFFCDSGSVAVEVAIKMAIQYWAGLGRGNKQKLLTVRSGYHGDTLGAMAVCDPVTGMHSLFKDILVKHYFAEMPMCGYHDKWDEKYLNEIKDILNANHDSIAAIIMEPIVQGAGGMRFYSPRYLERVRELCDDFNVLLILDEIATGFGRTGSMFACEKAGISPDIMCIGKALTGGYMTLAATLATENVSEGISLCGSGAFMHGPTFMANPLACSVALASIRLLMSYPWKDRVRAIEAQLKDELAPCLNLQGVRDVRALGAIGVVELKQPVDMADIQERFVDRGVWLRPFGRLVYTMPPYVIKKEDLSKITGAISEVLKETDHV
ncbi:MAG: adenosylmethionine--8-amino-7-oxononanoate transaminase [Deltaproteobacteria bacterium]|nr:adenosylmethionine--8-amino-7-oxononanoate transaminase [Deltaproteobacteria bacterium]